MSGQINRQDKHREKELRGKVCTVLCRNFLRSQFYNIGCTVPFLQNGNMYDILDHIVMDVIVYSMHYLHKK